MPDTRHHLMMQFLTHYLGEDFQINSLAGDASFRRYHRIYHNHHTFLLMDAPPQKEAVQPFIDIAQIFSQVMNVPDIIHQDSANGFLLLQDFGEIEFAHMILDATKKNKCYHQAFDTLCQLQTLNIHDNHIQSVILAYSDEKYDEEMNLFSEWFVPFIGHLLNDEEKALWQSFKHMVIQYIQAQPKVVVHRDYHSRNLMQDKNSDKLGVIDFQDALIGSYSYDLVSLIRDAYIQESNAWVQQKAEEFHRLANIKKPFEAFYFDVNMTGIQRHLKVLGIFVRLYQRDGKDKYLKNIPKQWQDLTDELANLQCNTNLSHADLSLIHQFYAFIQKLQKPYEQTLLQS